ncbi:hypothetical protein TPHV1_10332 [Treponema phagedenis]|uniref:Uncharacterized protein n=1 Tax=Treponema phagedenis TaxID=162 RepID=A0A0B7GQ02_TREPH|nr:hypothetical protein TPHV1_10332 [Treponema phagedenis]
MSKLTIGMVNSQPIIVGVTIIYAIEIFYLMAPLYNLQKK